MHGVLLCSTFCLSLCLHLLKPFCPIFKKAKITHLPGHLWKLLLYSFSKWQISMGNFEGNRSFYFVSHLHLPHCHDPCFALEGMGGSAKFRSGSEKLKGLCDLLQPYAGTLCTMGVPCDHWEALCTYLLAYGIPVSLHLLKGQCDLLQTCGGETVFLSYPREKESLKIIFLDNGSGAHLNLHFCEYIQAQLGICTVG